MKKEVMVVLAVLALIMMAASLNAEEDFIEDGYQCMEDQVNEKGCSELSLQENIFTVLSTGQCIPELKSKAKEKGCWGEDSCNIKKTSQAILALETKGEDTGNYTSWIKNKTRTDSSINWFLQVNSESTSCTLNTSDGSFGFDINSNDELSKTSSSNCFSITESGYRVKVSDSCYIKDIEASCGKTFSTTLQFESRSSQITHILESSQETSSSKELNIDSFCLGKSTCSYESTLWGALALEAKSDNEYKKFLPYLTTFKNDNQLYIPSSFLYIITGEEDHSSDVMSAQNDQGFWFELSNEYYDTALALMSISDKDTESVSEAINWTKKEQGSDGCWNDKNLKDTGFLLYSLDPKTGSSSTSTESDDGEKPSCEDSGYHCLAGGTSACNEAAGQELSNYSCGWPSEVCCTEKQETTSCSDVGGNICSAGETCSGTEREDIEVNSGFCCEGNCEQDIDDSDGEDTQTSECSEETALGSCKSSCGPGQVQNSTYSCLSDSKVCCTPAPEEDSFIKENLTLIIIVAVLVILIALSIVFRKKIAGLFSGKSGKGQKGGRPGPPGPPGPGPPKKRPPQGPPKKRPPQGPRKRPKGQNDEVFNKLKQMKK